MRIKLGANGEDRVKKEIKTGLGDFHIWLRKPTFSEYCREAELPSGFMEHWLVVVDGWEGLEDEDGKSIEFSAETLEAVCTASREVFTAIAMACRDRFRLMDVTEEQAGNSAGTSSDTSADVQTAGAA